MALFRNFGVNHALGVTGLELLELAENFTFLDRKRISALYETADGH